MIGLKLIISTSIKPNCEPKSCNIDLYIYCINTLSLPVFAKLAVLVATTIISAIINFFIVFYNFLLFRLIDNAKVMWLF